MLNYLFSLCIIKEWIVFREFDAALQLFLFFPSSCFVLLSSSTSVFFRPRPSLSDNWSNMSLEFYGVVNTGQCVIAK